MLFPPRYYSVPSLWVWFGRDLSEMLGIIGNRRLGGFLTDYATVHLSMSILSLAALGVSRPTMRVLGYFSALYDRV